MDKITHEMRIAQWENIIKACNKSGIPKKTWCEQNNVPEKSFYYWQRRIRNELFQTPKNPEPTAVTTFVELQPTVKAYAIPEKAAAAIIHVNGCKIEISESASDAFLHRLIGVLAHVQ